MLDERVEYRQYLLRVSDLPEKESARLRYDTLCDSLSGLNRALQILARGFLDGRTDRASLHAARRFLESWYGYCDRDYYLLEEDVWTPVDWDQWEKASKAEMQTAVQSLLPGRRVFLCFPKSLEANDAWQQLQRKADFEADLSISSADRKIINAAANCLPEYMRQRLLQSKYDALLRAVEKNGCDGSVLSAVQAWFSAVNADIDRRFRPDEIGCLPKEQYHLAQQLLSDCLPTEQANDLKNQILPVQKTVDEIKNLAEQGWSFSQPEMHTGPERDHDFSRILLDRVLSAALVEGPLQKYWLVAEKSRKSDSGRTLMKDIYSMGKNSLLITDENNRNCKTQITQVLKLTAAALLARRSAGRSAGPVMLNHAVLANWLCTTMENKSKEKRSPLRKYYFGFPEAHPLVPETRMSGTIHVVHLCPEWEQEWNWKIYSEAELAAAVKKGDVDKDALCFTDEDTPFAPKNLREARAGEIAEQEGVKIHDAES